jgi:succinate dehydrogenase hydrophobic anchor subunit
LLFESILLGGWLLSTYTTVILIFYLTVIILIILPTDGIEPTSQV